MSGIRRFFNKVRFGLQFKLSVIGIAGISIMMVASFLGSWLMSARYNRELYEKSAMNTSYISNTLMLDLNAIAFLAESVSTDATYIDNLTLIERGDAAILDEVLAHLEIMNHAMSFLNYNSNIESITFVTQNRIINTGTPFELSTQQQQQGRYAATQALEEPIFINFKTEEMDHASIYIVRQIRSMPSKYDQLAILFIKVNLEQLIDQIVSRNSSALAGGQFILFDEQQKLLYPLEIPEIFSEIQFGFDGNYDIQRMQDDRYFITGNSLKPLEWQCFSITDYNLIFGAIRQMQIQSVLILLGFVGLSFFVTRHLTQELNGHFRLLIQKMRAFERGNFVQIGKSYANRRDEIGDIHRSFDEMVARFSELITDNYEKQIMLKDMQIQMLEQQIDPHFLYNTLDSINLLALCKGEAQIALMARSLGICSGKPSRKAARLFPSEEN
ncbi:MAG: sensor histidine kinase [Candidatus Merdivicinus sp.]|jgi:two-component system sensor histidine kinase YesM